MKAKKLLSASYLGLHDRDETIINRNLNAVSSIFLSCKDQQKLFGSRFSVLIFVFD